MDQEKGEGSRMSEEDTGDSAHSSSCDSPAAAAGSSRAVGAAVPGKKRRSVRRDDPDDPDLLDSQLPKWRCIQNETDTDSNDSIQNRFDSKSFKAIKAATRNTDSNDSFSKSRLQICSESIPTPSGGKVVMRDTDSNESISNRLQQIESVSIPTGSGIAVIKDTSCVENQKTLFHKEACEQEHGKCVLLKDQMFKNVFTSTEDILETDNSAAPDFTQVSQKRVVPYLIPRDSIGLCAAEVESPSAHAHINALPLPVMTSIFSHLTLPDLLRRACLVCRYWRNVAYDSELWREVSAKLHPKMDDATLLGLTRLSSNVTRLDLTDSKRITSPAIVKVLKQCAGLVTLVLTRVDDLTPECLASIGKHCANLNRLHLDACRRVNDAALKEIAAGCGRHLEELKLNYCHDVTSEGVVHIAASCHQLKQLMLSQCSQVRDSCMERLVRGCPLLESLIMMSCGLTNVGIRSIAQLKYLKVLDVSDIGTLSKDSVRMIVRSCVRIEHLNVSLCRDVDDECVRYIAEKARNLKILYMVACSVTDEGLEHVANHAAKLDTLDVGWCQQINLAGVERVSTALQGSLRYFGLMRCDKLLPSAMNDMVRRFPSITFSTMHLDCQRLLERAQRDGHVIDGNVIDVA